MKQIFTKLWRATIVTVFMLIFWGCGARDLSHDPEVVDQITTEYISTQLAVDLVNFDSDICSVERIKLTRQDNIPVALVNLTRKSGASVREFYHFDYADISRVRDAMEQQDMSSADLANKLDMPEFQVKLFQQIILRAKCAKSGK